MTAKNDITGDLIQTKANSAQYKENIGKIFGNGGVKGGSWVYDSISRKMVPREAYRKENPLPKKRGHFKGAESFDAFESPSTGEIVTSHKKLKYDQESSGCRTYEGREQEDKEAARYRAEENKKYEDSVGEAVEQTFYDLKYNRVQKESTIDTGWLADE